MSTSSQRLSLVFSSLGHAYMHLLAVYFFIIVLPLERAWNMPYHELIDLWTVGSLLVGLLALPAGWLGDRWSATGMMVVFFVGLGLAAIVCGLAASPASLWVGLCLLGTFASIYHPVGIPWLVRNVESRGRALGVNGIFGNAGVAGAGLVAGSLIDAFGWRAALVIPGVVSIATGIVMAYCRHAGLLHDQGPRRPGTPAGRQSRARAFGILLVTMFGGAIIYQATQAALPKLFATRLSDLAGPGTIGIGVFVAVVYGIAAISQVPAGQLTDRYSLKPVYTIALLGQVPMLWLAATLGGPPLVLAAAAMVVLNVGSLPAENLLLVRATPDRHQGLAFGVKFLLAFGATPVAIKLVAYLTSTTGGFEWLFVTLAGCAAITAGAALLLPSGPAPILPRVALEAER